MVEFDMDSCRYLAGMARTKTKKLDLTRMKKKNRQYTFWTNVSISNRDIELDLY